MKKLLIAMICSFFCITLFAQTDSSNTNSNSHSAATMNATNNMDTAHHMNNNMDTTNHMNNMPTSSSMNNSSMSSGSMGSITTPMPKASLPVLETYIPADVVSDIKQKISGGDQVYDITAVKAPRDSSMMNNNSASTSATNNSTSADSTNKNATNTTNNTNNGANMNNTNSISMPQSWDYVVRVIRNGAITTEKLDASGNQLNQ